MTLLELTRQAGLNPKWVASTAGDEYHSACPSCGGTDRFYIQPNKQMAKCLGVIVAVNAVSMAIRFNSHVSF